MKPPSAAIEKANQKPRPLTDEQQAIVDQRDAETARKLKGLERTFAKDRTKVQSTIVSKDSNGWTR